MLMKVGCRFRLQNENTLLPKKNARNKCFIGYCPRYNTNPKHQQISSVPLSGYLLLQQECESPKSILQNRAWMSKKQITRDG